MYSQAKKRPKKRTPKGRATKPFQAPGAQQKSVIPGMLKQTAVEKKVMLAGSADAINVPAAFNSTGLIACVNLIQVGSSMFNRIGRKIEMRSIRLRLDVVTLNVTRQVISPDKARITVVYDRQTNGAFPTLNDIYLDTEQSGANTRTILSGLNMDNRERFVTLIDKSIVLPQATCTAGVLTNVYPDNGENVTQIDEFRKLNGLTTHFKADSNPAVIGDISTGALYFITYASIAAGSELFTAGWNCRLKYVDV